MQKYTWQFYAAIACGVFALILFGSFIGFCAGLPGVELENSGRGRWISLVLAIGLGALASLYLWPKRYRAGPGA